MKTFKTINSLQKEIKVLKKRKLLIGFVPTMGALHEGHLSLIDKCRQDNDIVILSIFVNPTQFAPNEDFKKYPREEKSDVLLARSRNVDIIFYPSEKEMYPASFLTSVKVNDLDAVLCGRSRPGHFVGVTTIVAKLLIIVDPDMLYLGQKDAQQAIIIKTMIKDLNIPVKLKICPIMRAKDGLALSSRNKYLNTQERLQAVFLNKALKGARLAIRTGEKNTRKIVNLIENVITKNSNAVIEYVECVDSRTLTRLKELKGDVLIAVAVKFRKTRLIDNIIVHS